MRRLNVVLMLVLVIASVLPLAPPGPGRRIPPPLRHPGGIRLHPLHRDRHGASPLREPDRRPPRDRRLRRRADWLRRLHASSRPRRRLEGEHHPRGREPRAGRFRGLSSRALPSTSRSTTC